MGPNEPESSRFPREFDWQFHDAMDACISAKFFRSGSQNSKARKRTFAGFFISRFTQLSIRPPYDDEPYVQSLLALIAPSHRSQHEVPFKKLRHKAIALQGV
jgi:hypothetical protein